MDCEKDVLRIQKKLDKIVKEELVRHDSSCVWHVTFQVSNSTFFLFSRAKMKH